MENVYKALEQVIDCIKCSSDYQTCLSLKEKMSHNDEIMNLIQKVKDTQKKYIRSDCSEKVKKELDSYQEQLMNIPIYHMYNDSLEKVNEMISYVKDTFNDYFYQILN